MTKVCFVQVKLLTLTKPNEGLGIPIDLTPETFPRLKQLIMKEVAMPLISSPSLKELSIHNVWSFSDAEKINIGANPKLKILNMELCDIEIFDLQFPLLQLKMLCLSNTNMVVSVSTWKQYVPNLHTIKVSNSLMVLKDLKTPILPWTIEFSGVCSRSNSCRDFIFSNRFGEVTCADQLHDCFVRIPAGHRFCEKWVLKKTNPRTKTQNAIAN